MASVEIINGVQVNVYNCFTDILNVSLLQTYIFKFSKCLQIEHCRFLKSLINEKDYKRDGREGTDSQV